MTYLFILSFSYTEFNSKFLIKLQKYTSLKRVIPINKLLDILYSISINNIPIINTLINPDLFKDIIIRHILFNYLYKKYSLQGGSFKKSSAKKSSAKKSSAKKSSAKKSSAKKSIFILDAKFEKYTKKDWYNEFLEDSPISSLKLLNTLEMFYKNDGIKLLMTCINDYMPHIDQNVNKIIMKHVNKYNSHHLNKQFKTFFDKKLLMLK
jgi:hypothetical protein